MKLQLFPLCLVAALIFACGGSSDRAQGSAAPTAAAIAPVVPTRAQPTATPQPLKFAKGRNDYTLMVDGARREFTVYVPQSYVPSTPAPLVFVLHGTSGGGPNSLAEFGWKEECDKVGCIGIFPTSLSYFLTDAGHAGTRWNATALVRQTRPGTALADDVHFVREILAVANATWNVDPKRVYATGFSNGAGFVTSRLVVQMPDVFAAFGVCGAGIETDGLLPKDGLARPLYLVMGSIDPIALDILGTGEKSLPLEAAQIVSNPLLGRLLADAEKTLSLGPEYTTQYERPNFTTLTFNHDLGGRGVELRFRMVWGVGHAYFHGSDRTGLVAADLFWGFFAEHPLR